MPLASATDNSDKIKKMQILQHLFWEKKSSMITENLLFGSCKTQKIVLKL